MYPYVNWPGGSAGLAPDGVGRCLAVDAGELAWTPTACEETHRFVCEKSKFIDIPAITETEAVLICCQVK